MKEVEIPATPCCGNCAAWQQTNGVQGECHFAPPQAIFMGFQQGRIAGQQPQPIIAGVFPAAIATSFCRQWVPDADEPTAEGAAAGAGLVAHAGQDPVRRTSAVANIIERAKSVSFDAAEAVSQGREPAPVSPLPQIEHTPSKVGGVWHCSACGATGDDLEKTWCKANPNATA